MTCIDCGKIFPGQDEGLYICPACWERFRRQTPEQQLRELIIKTGGTNAEIFQRDTDRGDVRLDKADRPRILPETLAAVRVSACRQERQDPDRQREVRPLACT